MNEERAIRTLALLARFGLLRGAGAREKWLGMASMSGAGVQALSLSLSVCLLCWGMVLCLDRIFRRCGGDCRQGEGGERVGRRGGSFYVLDVFVSFCVVNSVPRVMCTVGGEGRFWACTLYFTLNFLPGPFFTFVCLSICSIRTRAQSPTLKMGGS